MAKTPKGWLGKSISGGRTLWVILSISTVLLMSCAQPPLDSSQAAGMKQPGGVMHIDVSRAKAYHSLRELAADADLIVRVIATTQHSVELVEGYPQDPLPIPYTVTSVTAREVLKGRLSGPTLLKIRQIGSSDASVQVDHAPAILQSGHSYLLFLDVFTYGPGRATDEYVLVGGGAGLFSDDGADVGSLDTDSPDLPRHAPLGDVKAMIAA